jgi:3-oxoacyl-[acyl-carrier-protein] synthase II
MSRRVVITGLGVITSMGEEVGVLWENLLAGKSGIGPITRWPIEEFAVKFGGECTEFRPENHGIDSREAKRLDRFAQFGIAASKKAVDDSGIDFAKGNPFRQGVLIGTGIGGIETLQEQSRILLQKGPKRLSPFTVPRLMGNAASGNVSILYGLRGPNTAVATACATGANAIGDAMKLIQRDMADVMIAGGAEAALCELGLGSFIAARALSTRNDAPTEASRPWDVDRDGFVQSEGAGIVILEEFEHAKARGAKIYAEVAGYGMTADAHHITAVIEDGSGAAQAMRLALDDAKLTGEDVSYVNAHGTSTPIGDPAETAAVKSAFGETAAKKTMLSSTKSMLGHSLGATGGVETVICALSIKHDVIPPTINLHHPDTEHGCDLDYTPLTARQTPVKVAMNNSFGFGGHNATLVMKKVD